MIRGLVRLHDGVREKRRDQFLVFAADERICPCLVWHFCALALEGPDFSGS
jgi:hypothetical protein